MASSCVHDLIIRVHKDGRAVGVGRVSGGHEARGLGREGEGRTKRPEGLSNGYLKSKGQGEERDELRRMAEKEGKVGGEGKNRAGW